MAVATILTNISEFNQALDRARGSVAYIGHNTTVESRSPWYRVRYHGNTIAQYRTEDFAIILSDGDYASYTTAGRLNQITTAHGAGWVNYRRNENEIIFTSWHTGKKYVIGHGSPLVFFAGGEVHERCRPIQWPAHAIVLDNLQDSPALHEELQNAASCEEFCAMLKANKKTLGYRRLTQLNLPELYHDITGEKPWH